ncbi:MAG: hypothetical protein K6A30_07250 [Lachnospiraceae bacterium]|nr:hypothetical protein [Lachnospiraceae bacterium]
MLRTKSFHYYNPGTAVPVIASFNPSGEIRPLYLRMDGTVLRIRSFWVKSHHLNAMEFNCKVIDNNYTKNIRLIYYMSEGVWISPP